MLVVCNDRQEVIARFAIEKGPALSRPIVVTNANFRGVMESLRAVDKSLLTVRVCYPRVSEEFIDFNTGTSTMDIDSAIMDSHPASHKPAKQTDAPTLYLAPITEELPNDGVLSYSTVETLSDLSSCADRTVVLLRDEQMDMIRCVHDYPSLFRLNLMVMTGLPAANYTAAFEEATWSYDKLAYAPFISELRVAGEIESQLQSQNETVYDKEKQRYTRSSGEVKPHSDFVVATHAGVSDDEDNNFSV